MHIVAENDGILLLGASATQLFKLDHMQHFIEQLCSSSFVPLQRCHHAAAIGLLCKLLDGTCREHLQRFCLAFLSSMSLTTEISLSESSAIIFVGGSHWNYILGLVSPEFSWMYC